VERVDLGVVEGGGGLVHDEHPRVVREGLGDLDHLLLGDREAVDLGASGRAAAETVDELASLRLELPSAS
jgi:hypothetical protein